MSIQNLTIDPQRLWDTSHGDRADRRHPKGGIRRLTLTDLDKQVRDWFKANARRWAAP